MSFENFYNTVMTSPLGHAMRAIKEDSAWHREENVARHTEMTIRWYEDNLENSRTPNERIITKIALLFHDTGKPMARTEKFSEARGTYYSYPGHELMSARVFEDYALTNLQDINKEFIFEWSHIEQIKCLIEHHLPYEKTGKDKLIALKTHIHHMGGPKLERMYFDVLRSDAHGRISDDPDGTYARVEDWIAKFQAVEINKSVINVEAPYIMLAIGASGSGKTSFYQKHFASNSFDHLQYWFNLDNLRMMFYGIQTGEKPVYNIAWNFIHRNEDKAVEKAFDAWCLSVFTDHVKHKHNLYVDISNVSAKARRRWITLARQHGYAVHAVHFAIPYQLCLNRQKTRGDKEIPERSVREQYFRISTPLIGTEVDTLTTTFPYDFPELT